MKYVIYDLVKKDFLRLSNGDAKIYITRGSANKVMDRKNLEYGAYRYLVEIFFEV